MMTSFDASSTDDEEETPMTEAEAHVVANATAVSNHNAPLSLEDDVEAGIAGSVDDDNNMSDSNRSHSNSKSTTGSNHRSLETHETTEDQRPQQEEEEEDELSVMEGYSSHLEEEEDNAEEVMIDPFPSGSGSGSSSSDRDNNNNNNNDDNNSSSGSSWMTEGHADVELGLQDLESDNENNGDNHPGDADNESSDDDVRTEHLEHFTQRRVAFAAGTEEEAAGTTTAGGGEPANHNTDMHDFGVRGRAWKLGRIFVHVILFPLLVITSVAIPIVLVMFCFALMFVATVVLLCVYYCCSPRGRNGQAAVPFHVLIRQILEAVEDEAGAGMGNGDGVNALPKHSRQEIQNALVRRTLVHFEVTDPDTHQVVPDEEPKDEATWEERMHQDMFPIILPPPQDPSTSAHPTSATALENSNNNNNNHEEDTEEAKPSGFLRRRWSQSSRKRKNANKETKLEEEDESEHNNTYELRLAKGKIAFKTDPDANHSKLFLFQRTYVFSPPLESVQVKSPEDNEEKDDDSGVMNEPMDIINNNNNNNVDEETRNYNLAVAALEDSSSSSSSSSGFFPILHSSESSSSSSSSSSSASVPEPAVDETGSQQSSSNMSFLIDDVESQNATEEGNGDYNDNDDNRDDDDDDDAIADNHESIPCVPPPSEVFPPAVNVYTQMMAGGGAAAFLNVDDMDGDEPDELEVDVEAVLGIESGYVEAATNSPGRIHRNKITDDNTGAIVMDSDTDSDRSKQDDPINLASVAVASQQPEFSSTGVDFTEGKGLPDDKLDDPADTDQESEIMTSSVPDAPGGSVDGAAIISAKVPLEEMKTEFAILSATTGDTDIESHGERSLVAPTSPEGSGHVTCDLDTSCYHSEYGESVHHEQHRGISSYCNICLLEYEVGDVVVWSRRPNGCHHAFHGDCLLDWLQRKPTCPNCRQEFFDVEDTPERQQDSSALEDSHEHSEEQEGAHAIVPVESDTNSSRFWYAGVD
mgnify:CR=1 FL=1